MGRCVGYATKFPKGTNNLSMIGQCIEWILEVSQSYRARCPYSHTVVKMFWTTLSAHIIISHHRARIDGLQIKVPTSFNVSGVPPVPAPRAGTITVTDLESRSSFLPLAQRIEIPTLNTARMILNTIRISTIQTLYIDLHALKV
ncbi:hypothetical protein PoB_003012400 [Plakobranchus ocellatus]|uniref:Uncharacterized protein n=1 Tax=Plakobranchus ocellatus TaxID=259542 RepID=A0AAV4A7H6_9GAST|nr:hypothetical protein PoB_003012400 [Plakobranchus ocellatus]